MTLGTNMTYSQLLAYFEPRVIKSDEQYWATQDIIDELLSKSNLSTDEQAYLDLLSLLIEAHDDENEIVPELRGIPLIKSLIEELELKQKDLLPIFKHESTVSDVLNGRRQLTIEHINRLANFFQLPHSLFFETIAEKPNIREVVPMHS